MDKLDLVTYFLSVNIKFACGGRENRKTFLYDGGGLKFVSSMALT